MRDSPTPAAMTDRRIKVFAAGGNIHVSIGSDGLGNEIAVALTPDAAIELAVAIKLIANMHALEGGGGSLHTSAESSNGL